LTYSEKKIGASWKTLLTYSEKGNKGRLKSQHIPEKDLKRDNSHEYEQKKLS